MAASVRHGPAPRLPRRTLRRLPACVRPHQLGRVATSCRQPDTERPGHGPAACPSAASGPRGPAGLVRRHGRDRGHPVGQDRRLPGGLPLLRPVVPFRHSGAGHAVPRHRRRCSRPPGRRPRLGASEFCIVLAVRGPDERTMRRLLELVPLVQAATGLNVAVSAGILDGPRPSAWRRAESTGTTTTSKRPGPFSRRSSPPTPGRSATRPAWQVKAAGMQLCCGVLLGMGETRRASAWS